MIGGRSTPAALTILHRVVLLYSVVVVTSRSRALLVCGVVAGPLFAVVGLVQAFTRPGFDLRRHALSMLENGDLGWIQISSFILTGLLFVSGDFGMSPVIRVGLGGTWMPVQN